MWLFEKIFKQEKNTLNHPWLIFKPKEEKKNMSKNFIKFSYKSQLENKLWPYATCGTTAIANIIEYLNFKDKTEFESNADRVFGILNSEDVIKIANNLISQSGNAWIKDFLVKRPDPITGKPTSYTRLNNVAIMLGELIKFITGYNYEMKYFSFEDIKKIIDEEKIPLLTWGNYVGTGHYVSIWGYNEEDKKNKKFIVKDPYGNWNTSKIIDGKNKYFDIGKSFGNDVEYSITELISRDVLVRGNQISNDYSKFLCIRFFK